MNALKLPDPAYRSNTSIEHALSERRSVRAYRDKPLAVPQVSQLLWAAQGITSSRGFRTAPSAGALFPLEVYAVAGNVDGLLTGIYRYTPPDHGLIMIAKGDMRGELCSAALGQSCVRESALVIVLGAVYERMTHYYGNRGTRYVHMEAGHAAQNIHLQAVSLNLGTVVLGAFRDQEVKEVMHMADREEPLIVMPVGRL